MRFFSASPVVFVLPLIEQCMPIFREYVDTIDLTIGVASQLLLGGTCASDSHDRQKQVLLLFRSD